MKQQRTVAVLVGALGALGLSLLLSMLLAAPLAAQTGPTGGGVSASPAQITVAATQGQRETRTLLIRTTAAVTGLHVVPLDLTGADGETVLPAEAIGVPVAPQDLAANALYTVPVTFDLTGAPSGQFSGELLVSYVGQTLTVPVRVAVKDPPWLALLALVGGVALGIGVSTYRAQGRPRDEVLVRLGQIRTQMKVDQKLQEVGEPFRARIEAALVDVEVALEGQQWETAHQALQAAEKVWDRWRRGRPDWLVQLASYRKLKAKLQTLDSGILYVEEVLQAARDCYRELPELEEPQAFRAKLEPLVRQANAFITLSHRIDALAELGPQGRARARALRQQLHTLAPGDAEGRATLRNAVETAMGKVQRAQLQAQVERLKEMSAALPEPHAEPWLEEAQALQEQVASIPPDDTGAYAALEEEIERAMQQVADLTPTEVLRGELSPEYAMTPKGVAGLDALASPMGLLTSLPQTTVQPLPEQIAEAGRRLRWFTALTYIVAVVFLALAGFVELYGARVDFGVNGVGDYFTLLAWGFGAEATRAAVADMVQGWGVPLGT